MAFLDMVLGKDERERKLEKEIRSLELRKESVFNAINGEIARLQGERRNVLLSAGTAAYEAWSKDQSQIDLTEYWGKAQEFERLIAEQETKRTEMGLKYDEEIRLINSTLAVSAVAPAVTAASAPAAAPAPAPATIKCPNCGAVISESAAFCKGCGAKLK